MKKRSPWLAVWALALGAPGAALATLGEPADSIANDRPASSPVEIRSTRGGAFSMQEYASEGTAVREFVSPAGIVFAVAWNGFAHPDLSRLLGGYAAQYRDTLRRSPRSQERGRRTVQGQDVVVQTWGHMRNLGGRAYAPALLPPGVSLDQIR